MIIRLTERAEADLATGAAFYEQQGDGLGEYFLDSLISDLESLQLYAGTHPKKFRFHRMLAKRFPFAIYYESGENEVLVCAVLDCRRKPAWTTGRLRRA